MKLKLQFAAIIFALQVLSGGVESTINAKAADGFGRSQFLRCGLSDEIQIKPGVVGDANNIFRDLHGNLFSVHSIPGLHQDSFDGDGYYHGSDIVYFLAPVGKEDGTTSTHAEGIHGIDERPSRGRSACEQIFAVTTGTGSADTTSAVQRERRKYSSVSFSERQNITSSPVEIFRCWRIRQQEGLYRIAEHGLCLGQPRHGMGDKAKLPRSPVENTNTVATADVCSSPAVLNTPVQRIFHAHVISRHSLLSRAFDAETAENAGAQFLPDGSLVVDPQHVAFAPWFEVALQCCVEHVGLKAVKDGHGLGAGLLHGATKRSRD